MLFSCCAVAGVFGGPALWNQLFRSRAEELYSGASDPFASRVVSQILLDAGIAGARAVVIPIQETAGQIAVITLDEGEGFTGMGSASANEMAMMSIIQRMREDNRMEELGIDRVTVDYRDEKQLFGALDRLLEDRAYSQELAQNAQQHLRKHFLASRMVSRLARAYRQALSL